MSSKVVLVKRLEKLAGFEGVDDVLEHLLTIESEQDLLNYLSQLLGNEGPEIKLFVADVCRFQQGAALSSGNFTQIVDDSKKPARQLQDNYIDGKPAIAKQQQKQKQSVGSKKVVGRVENKQSSVAQSKPKATSKNVQAARPKEEVVVKLPPMEEKREQPAKKEKEKPIQKYHPPKGKALIVCGCFGSLHEPLTNCLYCGRISCAREGYNFCPYCGFLVEPFETKADDAATQHLERLLRFDRDFARRTVVLDDQADYFSNQTSAWLTEEEQSDALKIESDRKTELHTRKKQTLNINF